MGIDVVVVAVGEIRAVVEEEFEPALAKLVAIALQVVGPELVNHYYNNQFGASVIGGSK